MRLKGKYLDLGSCELGLIFLNLGPDLCHIHSRILLSLHCKIIFMFPIHDRLHQCVSAFSFGDDGRRGDRLFSPRNDAQQATRLPHSSVKRDHDALNEGCTCVQCAPV